MAFAVASDGRRWVLRLPRRPDVLPRARAEARALALLGPRLPVAVPDWQVFDDALIAYPMLPGEPGLTFDPATHAVRWHFDPASPRYPETLGAVLAALHAIDPEALRGAGLPVRTVAEERAMRRDELARVAAGFEMPAARHRAWADWIAEDSFWPEATVPVHGDLYAGHALVDPEGGVLGLIDWTEARVGDPAVDLAGHVAAFGAEALPALIAAYAAAGGRTWPRMAEHCARLASLKPVEYAAYALATGDPGHRAAAQAALTDGAATA